MELAVIPFNYGETPTTAVDGITVPVAVLEDAQARANETRRTQFVGVVEHKSPVSQVLDSSEVPALNIGALNVRMNHRYFITGYVVSDDRDAVILHGCGRLIWVTPKIEFTHKGETLPVAEKSEHTPGPWSAHPSGRPESHLVGEGENAFYAADICIGSGEKIIGELQMRNHLTDQGKLGYPHVLTVEEMMANAALVFAAPDMLTTLRDVLAFLVGLDNISISHWAAVQVRDTIKKAEGRE